MSERAFREVAMRHGITMSSFAATEAGGSLSGNDGANVKFQTSPGTLFTNLYFRVFNHCGNFGEAEFSDYWDPGDLG